MTDGRQEYFMASCSCKALETGDLFFVSFKLMKRNKFKMLGQR